MKYIFMYKKNCLTKNTDPWLYAPPLGSGAVGKGEGGDGTDTLSPSCFVKLK